MSLIKSISGIRGTIGTPDGETLNPINIAEFVSAFASLVNTWKKREKALIVVGRDARMSGDMVHSIVLGALMGSSCDIIDIGLATTPTTEMAVIGHNADGGIIITASHNPREWNALKLLNKDAMFFSKEEGKRLMDLVNNQSYNFSNVDNLGKVISTESYLDKHIDAILALDLIDVDAIKNANFKVAFDAINSVGAIAVPRLLERLGVNIVKGLYTEVTGNFSHIAEPLPENLQDLSIAVKEGGFDIGFAVDPDVDRLSVVDENGNFIGEEYTIVAIADYILRNYGKKTATVSNLSSSRALRDVSLKYDCEYYSAAVGELNVVDKMMEVDALIGGEGNGGVIYPELHAGRDALLGIAFFLTILAKDKLKLSEIRASLPDYSMYKTKIELSKGIDAKSILSELSKLATDAKQSTIDGLKLDFEDSWVHIRTSNTEPIMRIYSEAKTMEKAQALALEYKNKIVSLTK